MPRGPSPSQHRRSAARPRRRWWQRLVQRRSIDSRAPTHVAFALTSLIAGLLLLFNLDRTLHRPTPPELGFNASQHGWPMIYLERNFPPETPNHVRSLRSYDWPWPAVIGETRTGNPIALVVDLAVMALLVVGSFLLFRRIATWALVPVKRKSDG